MSDTDTRKDELTALIQKLRDQESEVEVTLRDIRERLFQARTSLAELNCPYKMGQHVQEKRHFRGPSPTLEVVQIVPGSCRDDTWQLVVRQVKKDGTLGVNTRTTWVDVTAVEEKP